MPSCGIELPSLKSMDGAAMDGAADVRAAVAGMRISFESCCVGGKPADTLKVQSTWPPAFIMTGLFLVFRSLTAILRQNSTLIA
jgi:hypothetical protein